MARRVFISYNYQDSQIADSLPSMRRGQPHQRPGRFVYVTGTDTNHTRHAFDSEVRRVMQGCDAAVFLIGGGHHHSPYLDEEARLAVSRGLPIVVARLTGSSEDTPPALRSFPMVEVNPRDLAGALNHLERTRL